MVVKLVAFDLDGTLAPSKGPISSKMASSLKELLDFSPVCIITGGTKEQILSQVVSHLPNNANLRNLHLMPTSGSQYFTWGLGRWREIYSESFTEGQVKMILNSVEVAVEILGYWPEKFYGEVIQNRGSQITFSALGQDAPRRLKEKWDPTGEKRERLRSSVSALLPDYDVRSGGSTSIDVTRAGVDKGYGMSELSKRTGINCSEMLYVGDRLDVGGNDYSVIRTGAIVEAVSDPKQTLKIINMLVDRSL